MKKGFTHQLTKWLPPKDINSVIKQIQKYEGRCKGRYYVIKKQKDKVAVFTKGLSYKNHLYL